MLHSLRLLLRPRRPVSSRAFCRVAPGCAEGGAGISCSRHLPGEFLPPSHSQGLQRVDQAFPRRSSTAVCSALCLGLSTSLSSGFARDLKFLQSRQKEVALSPPLWPYFAQAVPQSLTAPSIRARPIGLVRPLRSALFLEQTQYQSGLCNCT